MITIEQIRAARALLGWSQSDLADYAGLSQTGIARIENRTNRPNAKTINKIITAFESFSIEFISQDGVRKKSGEIITLKGQEGFNSFYEDVYRTLEKKPGQVYLNNVDERLFEQWLGDHLKGHVEKILSMKDVSYKILIKEGDTHFITSEFSEYRWLSEALFTDATVPTYIYGEKIALILFKEYPTILIIDYPEIAQAYRKQFEALWHMSKIPQKK